MGGAPPVARLLIVAETPVNLLDNGFDPANPRLEYSRHRPYVIESIFRPCGYAVGPFEAP